MSAIDAGCGCQADERLPNIIEVRIVRRPRRVYYCASCRTILYEHVALFGRAERGDRPYWLRLCPADACLGTPRDSRIRQAVRMLTPEV